MTQKEIAEDIRQAVETLRRGGLILYPTDTVWGIGCDATNEEAVRWDLIEFAERPLTLILDGAVNLAPSLIAEDGSVGLRVTREAISHELCYRFQKAIVSTSANISGQPAAAIFSEIDPAVIAGVDYVMRSRQNDTKPARPSQIMRLKADGEFKVLRP